MRSWLNWWQTRSGQEARQARILATATNATSWAATIARSRGVELSAVLALPPALLERSAAQAMVDTARHDALQRLAADPFAPPPHGEDVYTRAVATLMVQEQRRRRAEIEEEQNRLLGILEQQMQQMRGDP